MQLCNIAIHHCHKTTQTIGTIAASCTCGGGDNARLMRIDIHGILLSIATRHTSAHKLASATSPLNSRPSESSTRINISAPPFGVQKESNGSRFQHFFIPCCSYSSCTGGSGTILQSDSPLLHCMARKHSEWLMCTMAWHSGQFLCPLQYIF